MFARCEIISLCDIISEEIFVLERARVYFKVNIRFSSF